LLFRDLLAGHDCLDEAGGRYAPLSPSRHRGPSKGCFPMCYGPSYIAEELAQWIGANGMSHVRGAPMHPQTQGKIERWHQTLKNRILLENYFLPGDLETRIEAFIDHYNHRRYHESLGNVTPADTYFGRADAIIQQRERIKRKTIEHRRLQHRKLAA
ncbi:integrase core domain-containing protein, partial [Sphingopyxis sp. NFH-91]|uniref:integrase core domain-containing protein n=1 Tax=Sphingopyxis sp. NFH-91 TaxID=2744457 RepID=UPI001F465567